MDEADRKARAAMRALAIATLAIVGLVFSFTPAAGRLDAVLLDAEWWLLRRVDPRPAPDDIIIVGVDDATVGAIPQPPGLWHEPLGRVLLRIAAARPRAIGLDLALPERSFEAIRPGLDRALFLGLVAARENGPFVVALGIDARTRTARPIHAPFLAVLQEERLGIDLLARDIDGATRRFSLVIPTEEGGFPTFVGRLCRALSKGCRDGLIHFALGPPYRYVPFQRVLQLQDTQVLASLFRDRIVLIGTTQRYSDRIAVPENLAGWEAQGGDSPDIVVHAQSLRTALSGAAPGEISRPFVMVLVSLSALVGALRNTRTRLLVGALGAGVLALGATFVLARGLYVPLSAGLVTLALACALPAALEAWRRPCTRERL
ncbi:MAG TPA: CHASE2 domain-containing protein [Usitatibacter sp.]|nr:CHASE2 domain-containing protein [Usitatibacter sp.]